MPRFWPIVVLVAACGTEPDSRPATLEVVTLTVLAPSCGQVQCHSSSTMREKDYEFDTVEGAREALGTNGLKVNEAVARGLPLENDLMNVINADGLDRMPPDSPLADEDIVLIESWLVAGAPGVP